MSHDRQYLDLVRHILETGERRDDRTGIGTISVFGTQTRYDLKAGFPLLTTKKVLFPAVVRELLWFLRGRTNIHDDLTQYTPIWDAWADENGDLGPIYSHQWRRFGSEPCPECRNRVVIDHDLEQHAIPGPCARCDGTGWAGGVDQIADVIAAIKTNPLSRRHIVTAWNPVDLPRMALPPCHLLFQFYVRGGTLDCQMYQRSADMALGVPFNIASYALLTIIIAQECGLVPGVLIHTIGDAHVYSNHVEGLERQLQREPFPEPRVEVARRPWRDLRFEDFRLEGYRHHPFIRFEVAV